MITPSTFSIVAIDLESQSLGVAVASKFPGVGSIVPWVSSGAGAVATQSYANTSFGPKALELMAHGLTAEEVLPILLRTDAEREQRQVGLVDHQGGSATFTGAKCHEWAGGKTGVGYAVQGNILAGSQVVSALAQTFEETAGQPIYWRLYHALLAADRAGGDRRGRQSAAIYVAKPDAGYGGFNDRWIDYRVDDHADPVQRLGELLEMHELYFGSGASEDRLTLQGATLQELQKIIHRLGYYSGPIAGELDEQTQACLTAFIGNENFEERVDFAQGTIDKPVFEFLVKRFGDRK